MGHWLRTLHMPVHVMCETGSFCFSQLSEKSHSVTVEGRKKQGLVVIQISSYRWDLKKYWRWCFLRNIQKFTRKDAWCIAPAPWAMTSRCHMISWHHLWVLPRGQWQICGSSVSWGGWPPPLEKPSSISGRKTKKPKKPGSDCLQEEERTATGGWIGCARQALLGFPQGWGAAGFTHPFPSPLEARSL